MDPKRTLKLYCAESQECYPGVTYRCLSVRRLFAMKTSEHAAEIPCHNSVVFALVKSRPPLPP